MTNRRSRPIMLDTEKLPDELATPKYYDAFVICTNCDFRGEPLRILFGTTIDEQACPICGCHKLGKLVRATPTPRELNENLLNHLERRRRESTFAPGSTEALINDFTRDSLDDQTRVDVLRNGWANLPDIRAAILSNPLRPLQPAEDPEALSIPMSEIPQRVIEGDSVQITFPLSTPGVANRNNDIFPERQPIWLPSNIGVLHEEELLPDDVTVLPIEPNSEGIVGVTERGTPVRFNNEGQLTIADPAAVERMLRERPPAISHGSTWNHAQVFDGRRFINSWSDERENQMRPADPRTSDGAE